MKSWHTLASRPNWAPASSQLISQQPLRLTVTRLTPILGLRFARCGNRWTMLILAILLVLALIFGIGSVLEGLAWGFLIVVALLVAAAVYGYKKLAR